MQEAVSPRTAYKIEKGPDALRVSRPCWNKEEIGLQPSEDPFFSFSWALVWLIPQVLRLQCGDVRMVEPFRGHEVPPSKGPEQWKCLVPMRIVYVRQPAIPLNPCPTHVPITVMPSAVRSSPQPSRRWCHVLGSSELWARGFWLGASDATRNAASCTGRPGAESQLRTLTPVPGSYRPWGQQVMVPEAGLSALASRRGLAQPWSGQASEEQTSKWVLVMALSHLATHFEKHWRKKKIYELKSPLSFIRYPAAGEPL